MMNDSPFVNESDTNIWKQKYTETEAGKKVRFFPRVEQHAEVANIMKAADCGIFPSRAEGWNLEALEMMCCGKHVIISDCTAHQEFCDDSNSKLVEMGALEEAHDGVWFGGQGKWSSIGDTQIDEFARHMREIHLLKQTGVLEPNTNGMKTAKQFDWANSAKQFLFQCKIT
jgi:glycosyltransferase involved in cell wall biosynthesis